MKISVEIYPKITQELNNQTIKTKNPLYNQESKTNSIKKNPKHILSPTIISTFFTLSI